MTTSAQPTPLILAHSNPPPGMVFVASPQELREDRSLRGSAPSVERAWDRLGLDGALFIDGRPALYLKEHGRPFTAQERIRLHRLFWNQGMANVLVLADPSRVYLYSALAPPTSEERSQGDERALVDALDQAAYTQGLRDMLLALSNGAYYERHRARFQPTEAVDAYLLGNLDALQEQLCSGGDGLPDRTAHALLGRLLFACYLLDRGVVSLDSPGGKTGTAALADSLERSPTAEGRSEFLYGWFGKLKAQFNGTMFDQDLAAERHLLRKRHIDALVHFVGGHEVRGGQRTLGFWAYDFGLIPVETISAIYESFLGAQDEGGKRMTGAFYTPRALAETVLDIAEEGAGGDMAAARCLDPACGSGIFLVLLFSRMANAWLADQPARPTYAARVNAFQSILRERIRGIDINETACRIACFSLYLAYLDLLAPPDVREHASRTGKALPRLLDDGTPEGPQSRELIPVIRVGDALAERPEPAGRFDVVIGNPPWRERPERLAQKFTEATPDFLRPGGVACFLLPTSLILNRTDAFQSRFLGRVTLERVIQLADYRHLLFRNARRPALIARFRNRPPNVVADAIVFDSPKFRHDTLREGRIVVGPADRSTIPLHALLAAAGRGEAPALWKRHFWGTSRDMKLLDILSDMPRLGEIAGKPGEGRRWIAGEGLQPSHGPRGPRPNRWPPGTPFLPAATRFRLCLVPEDCIGFGTRLRQIGADPDTLRRCPDRRLFSPPMTLISKGFEKIAFCGFRVLFQHAVRSIAGPKQDTDLLAFLAAYLRSPLARYFLFHTAGNWGTERTEVQLDELLSIPFPLPGSECAGPAAARIVREIGGRVRTLGRRLAQEHASDGRAKAADRVQREIDPLVYEYFGLTEQEVMVIEDTVEVSIPSATPRTWWPDDGLFTLDTVASPRPASYARGLAVYADTLTTTMNSWAAERGSRLRIVAEGGADDSTGMAMVVLRVDVQQRPFAPRDVSRDLWDALDRYKRGGAMRRLAFLDHARDIVLFRGETIRIVRPSILANWTRTAALNDAATFYGEIVVSGKRCG